MFDNCLQFRVKCSANCCSLFCCKFTFDTNAKVVSGVFGCCGVLANSWSHLFSCHPLIIACVLVVTIWDRSKTNTKIKTKKKWIVFSSSFRMSGWRETTSLHCLFNWLVIVGISDGKKYEKLRWHLTQICSK